MAATHLGGSGSPRHRADGVTQVARTTGLSRTAVGAGVREIEARARLPSPAARLVAGLGAFLEAGDSSGSDESSPLKLSERGA